MKHVSWIFFVGCLVFVGGCQGKRGPGSTSGYSPSSGVSKLQTVYFDLDKSVIRDDQAAALSSNAQIMQAGNRLYVTIEGHCDERGTNEYNMALGDRRATAAKNYLINLGVDPAQMSGVSYGEERPVCHESDESCWWRNRRAEFVK